MIGRPLSGTFYRLHSPRWAYQPTSGAGAAKHGGRANRAGVEALYLAGNVETAVAEFKQSVSVGRPLTGSDEPDCVRCRLVRVIRCCQPE